MKKTLLTLGVLSASLILTACTTGPDMTTATNSPAPSASLSPEPMPEVTEVIPMIQNGMDEMGDAMNDAIDSVTGQPTAVPESTGVTSMDKARRVVEQIEDELERLSEVDDAQVVIAGDKAAVALEFDDQYQGGIDDRLREIVQERIDGVVRGVTNVVITEERSFMDQLEMLGDRLESATDLTDLQNELNAIINQIEAGMA